MCEWISYSATEKPCPRQKTSFISFVLLASFSDGRLRNTFPFYAAGALPFFRSRKQKRGAAGSNATRVVIICPSYANLSCEDVTIIQLKQLSWIFGNVTPGSEAYLVIMSPTIIIITNGFIKSRSALTVNSRNTSNGKNRQIFFSPRE